VRGKEKVIAELRRLATRTKDAERERTPLSLAERLEAGKDLFNEIELLFNAAKDGKRPARASGIRFDPLAAAFCARLCDHVGDEIILRGPIGSDVVSEGDSEIALQRRVGPGGV
jgi:hypothetical protein